MLLTPTYSKTEYTSFEQMLIAGIDWGGLNERIVPILVQDCDVPEKLRAIKYLDFRGISFLSETHTALADKRIITTYCLKLPQLALAEALVEDLGFSERLSTFIFNSETGELLARDSYLEFNDGTRVGFSQEAMDAALDRLWARSGRSLLGKGYCISDYVIEGFRARWGQEDVSLPSDAFICGLFEKLTSRLSDCTNHELACALEDYAFNLPVDFDRSFLNHLPKPSPAWILLAELACREEVWDRLCSCFITISTVMQGYSDIPVVWIAEIVKKRDQIRDSRVRRDIASCMPADPSHIKTWAEQVLDLWLASGE